MHPDKNCPICEKIIPVVERYPDYVCSTCAGRASTADGRPLKFYNESLSGGFLAFYADTNEPYLKGKMNAPCFIAGIPCIAAEARMGGIVIQVRREM